MKRSIVITISGCCDCPWRNGDKCKRLHISVENAAIINPACDYSFSKEEDYLLAVEAAVCKIFGVTTDVLSLPDRSYKSRELTRIMARATIYKLLYERGVWSLNWIGLRYRRNHATVLHGIRQVNNILDTKDAIWYGSVMAVYDELGLDRK